MNQELHLKRMAILITSKCTLKCKLCLSYSPYYDPQRHADLDYLKKAFKSFFSIVDSVDIFTLSGGEPLMHPHLVDIYKMLFLYENQINKSVDMVINSTLLLKEDLLDFLELKKDKIKIILSDYGNGLSPKIDENIELLKNRNITYRISRFNGENLYYDGWIDFTDHSIKWNTLEERDSNASKCMQRVGKYFIINEGEIHCCSRGFWRSYNNIIPKIKGEYVDLLNDDISVEEKQEDLRTMISLTSSESCSRCPGFSNDLPRHYPAEQL